MSRSAPNYNTPAPANYVAGIGRGALGFTTRSDIGPARAATALPDASAGAAPAGYVAGRGRGMGDLARDQGEAAPEVDRADYSESNYDEFAGYGERLFAAGVYEDDDREADNIYQSVDEQMENRRKRAREKQLLLEQKKQRTDRPRIADQFADLKRDLGSVSAFEWDAIPDIGDSSLKYKQSRKKESFMPVPDSLIASAGALRGDSIANAIDPRAGTDSFASGMATALPGVGSAGLASVMRGSAITSRLDKMSDSVSGQTVVDPKGYITSLNSIKVSSEAEIGDIKKARVLLQSVTSTNPKHGPGWIAAARVEELANKMASARKIILQGCEEAPDSEDVWLEAARLHPPDTAKAILANAVKRLPTSVKIWMQAAELETLEIRKKAVLRRSLEFIPNSVQLWKAAIALENATDARIMLARAVECVPQAVEMWLALARLETHENARKVLNQAREAIPTERATWITAAKLEEAHGNAHLVNRIVEKMVVSLAQYQVVIKRDDWLQDVIEAERAQSPLTCTALIRNTIGQGVEAEDRLKTWMDDADYCLTLHPPAVHTARAILNYALEIFPHKKSIWWQLANLEKEYGNASSLEDVLKRGVQHVPRAENLWLMAAKERWMAGNVPDARTILMEAFQANPKSEQIMLAAVKLEWENNEFVLAQRLLQRARELLGTERIILKSALLERELGQADETLRLLEEGIARYPQYPKYYLMAGQCCAEDKHDLVKAREYFLRGLKANVSSVPLWISLIRLEEQGKGVVKARPTGEMARVKVPSNDEIWLECIRLERRAGNEKLAENLMAQAIRECPTSGRLWSEILLTCPKTQRKARAIDANKKCDKQDAVVVLAVARLFEQSARYRKAQTWYERALSLQPTLGDAWVYYFAFQYVMYFRAELARDGSKRKKGLTLGNGSDPEADGAFMATAVDDTGEEGAGATSSSGSRRRRYGDDHMDGVDDDDEDEDNDRDANDTTASTTKGGNGGKSTEPDAYLHEIAQHAVAAGGAASSSVATSASMTAAAEDERVAALRHTVQRCIDAEPNRGELWCPLRKRTDLRRRSVAEVLLLAVEQEVLGFPIRYFTWTAPSSTTAAAASST